MKTMEEETQKALAGILQPEQVKRLKQIEVQQMGMRAFFNEEVQKSLKMTDEQKDKIKESLEKAREEHQEAMRKLDEQFRKDALEKTTGVLTDEQKKAWKEMVGEPFEIKFDERRLDKRAKESEEKKPEKKPEKKSDE